MAVTVPEMLKMSQAQLDDLFTQSPVGEIPSGEAKGTTGDLSAAGVYIRADASLEVGSPVEFEITLPPDVTGGQENVVIQCKGRVVRTDPTGATEDGKGVACVIDSYEFVRNS